MTFTVGNLQNPPEYVNGTLLVKQTTVGIQSTSSQVTCPAGTNGAICASDCSTLLTCAFNNPTPIASFTCKDLNSQEPYCNTGDGYCASYGYSSNCNKEAGFVCTDTGYFPDPKNSGRYYYCNDNGYADTYYCPSNYVYDSWNKRCQYTEDGRCGIVSCSYLNKFPAYISYLPHPAFYILCTKTGNEITTTMLRCPDDRFAYNVQYGRCEFDCQADGQYPDYQNCRRYYECYRQTGSFYYNLKYCASGSYFDAASGRCVVGAC